MTSRKKRSSIMLDTSACIAFLRGRKPPDAIAERRCGISAVVAAELWAGVFHKGGDKERHKLELLLETVDVLDFDSGAAAATGKVLGELATKGKGIGDFDAQIAGHALHLNATLVTANIRHFQRISGLELFPLRL